MVCIKDNTSPENCKTTRIIYAAMNNEMLPVLKVASFIRADIWRRFGGLGTVGMSANKLCVACVPIHNTLPIYSSVRSATAKTCINDILMSRASAERKVRKAIHKRASSKVDRKRLYTLLKSGKWSEDNFLHRQMRKHFKHGVCKTDSQFTVRSDSFKTEVVCGHLNVLINVGKAHGGYIRLVTTTSGKNVDLERKNLRLIFTPTGIEIHYAFDKNQAAECGKAIIGIDKGYTEAFVDSDGQTHGAGLGQVLTEYSDKASETGKVRNKLYALEKKHRKAGRTAKADRICRNNLGRKKITARREKAQRKLRDIAYRAAHGLVDKAATIAAEDLTAVIANKQKWKRFNRRMSSWCKGTLAQALDEITKQRKAYLVLVNAAYTSQMDSTTGLLEGKRVGDRFYRANGDVLQADHNAALNVQARLTDSEIGQFMPHRKVKVILLARSGATERQEA